jgi:hypothetical protein
MASIAHIVGELETIEHTLSVQVQYFNAQELWAHSETCSIAAGMVRAARKSLIHAEAVLAGDE